MKVALIKPDHLGDFILTIPCIRALLTMNFKVTFFAPKSNHFLIRHFFGESIEICSLNLAQFARQHSGEPPREVDLSTLRSFDKVIYLRDDTNFAAVAEEYAIDYIACKHQPFLHESLIHAEAVRTLSGAYDPLTLFPAHPWPTSISRLGLCVSAGFISNKIPLFQLYRIASVLRKRGVAQFRIFGGPREKDEANLLADSLGLDASSISIGGDSLGHFLAAAAQCDAIVGGDSGTMHILSTSAPTFSIFTSSPWWRFSPLGLENRLIYVDVPCRPCVQFHATLLNSCITRECLGALDSDEIAEAILSDQPLPRRTKSNAAVLRGACRATNHS